MTHEPRSQEYNHRSESPAADYTLLGLPIPVVAWLMTQTVAIVIGLFILIDSRIESHHDKGPHAAATAEIQAVRAELKAQFFTTVLPKLDHIQVNLSSFERRLGRIEGILERK